MLKMDLVDENFKEKLSAKVEEVNRLMALLTDYLNDLNSFEQFEESCPDIVDLWKLCKQMSFNLNVLMKVYGELKTNRKLMETFTASNEPCDAIRKRLKWLDKRLKYLLDKDVQTEDKERILQNMELRSKLRKSLEKSNMLKDLSKTSMDKNYEKTTVSIEKSEPQEPSGELHFSKAVVSILSNNPSSYHFLPLPNLNRLEWKEDLNDEIKDLDQTYMESLFQKIAELKNLLVTIKKSFETNTIRLPQTKSDLLSKFFKKEEEKTEISRMESKTHEGTLPMLVSQTKSKLIPQLVLNKDETTGWKPTLLAKRTSIFRDQQFSQNQYSKKPTIKNIEKYKKKDIVGEDNATTRTEFILSNYVNSTDPQQRIQGIKILAALKCDSDSLMGTFTRIFKHDDQIMVHYVSAKVCLMIGLWFPLMLKKLVFFLKFIQTDQKRDILRLIIDSPFFDASLKDQADFGELGALLNSLVESNENQGLSLLAALAIGRLRIQNPSAAQHILTHLADYREDVSEEELLEALTILAESFQIRSVFILSQLLTLIEHSPSWQRRLKCIEIIQNDYLLWMDVDKKRTRLTMEKCLWNDSSQFVRKAAAKYILSTVKRQKIIDRILKQLDSPDDGVKVSGVMSLAAVKIVDEKLTGKLFEMLEDDSSRPVAFQIKKFLSELRDKIQF